MGKFNTLSQKVKGLFPLVLSFLFGCITVAAILAWVFIFRVRDYFPTTRPLSYDGFVPWARPWSEMIYYWTNSLILIIAIYGAQQVRLLKRDMRNRNIRSAKEKSVDYCERYAKYVLLRRVFVRECESLGIGIYKMELNGFDISKLPPGTIETVEKKMKLDSSVTALNELELIAMAFTCGVADEAEGFRTIGRSFCATVATHYDIFTVRGSTHGGFENVRKLYEIWSGRISLDSLDKERKLIEGRIQTATNHNIKPIGL